MKTKLTKEQIKSYNMVFERLQHHNGRNINKLNLLTNKTCRIILKVLREEWGI